MPPPTPPPPPKECPAPWDEVKKPTLASTDYSPAFPTVVGQDPSAVGFSIPVTARGGSATRHTWKRVKHCRDGSDDCPNGPWDYDCEEVKVTYNDPLVRIDVSMDLAGSSKGWINGYLNGRYYGARQQEDLPQLWRLWGGSSMLVTDRFHYMPKDPGTHQGEFILITEGTPISGPQEIHVPYQVPVYLMDTTIGK